MLVTELYKIAPEEELLSDLGSVGRGMEERGSRDPLRRTVPGETPALRPDLTLITDPSTPPHGPALTHHTCHSTTAALGQVRERVVPTHSRLSDHRDRTESLLLVSSPANNK